MTPEFEKLLYFVIVPILPHWRAQILAPLSHPHKDLGICQALSGFHQIVAYPQITRAPSNYCFYVIFGVVSGRNHLRRIARECLSLTLPSWARPNS
jgi:hypothetical protein